jgi:hypothetical protein
VPGLDQEFGEEAASTLAALVGGGKRLRASVIGREKGVPGARHPGKAGGKLLVVLKEEGAARSINAEMLAGEDDGPGAGLKTCGWAGGRVGGCETHLPEQALAPPACAP